jgi:hypothetical protein
MKILIPLLFLVSCSATMMNHGGNRSAYAPAGYQEKGVVRYLNNGASFIVNQRREDAFKQMYTACNGAYRITREGSEKDGATINNNGFGGLNVNSYQYVVMTYECTQTAKAEAKTESRSVANAPVVNNGPIELKPGQIVNNCKTSADCAEGMSCKLHYMPSETYGMCGNHGLWGRLFYK